MQHNRNDHGRQTLQAVRFIDFIDIFKHVSP
jgi:hypothetical protein